MPDYTKGKIYRIVDTNGNTVYIGSTCLTLSRRFSTHKHKGNGNRIVLIKNCPCENKEQLLRREQEIMESHRELLNQYRAYQSPEQRREYKKEHSKHRYEANREHINEQKKEYYEANREQIREQQKEYHKANREQKKEYYAANSERIKARKAERVVCEHCGSEVRRGDLAKHKRTAKCKAHQPILPCVSDNTSASDQSDKSQPASPVCKSST